MFALVLWFPINTAVESWPFGVVDWLFELLMVGVAVVVFPALVVGTRGAFARPRVVLTEDSITVHDSCTLRQPMQFHRTDIAQVRALAPAELPHDEMGWSHADISPFVEPMSVELVFTSQHRMMEARSGIFGNWLWLYTRRPDAPLPRVPEQGQLYDAVRLRASETCAAAIARWHAM